jgi:hypothetical protein
VDDIAEAIEGDREAVALTVPVHPDRKRLADQIPSGTKPQQRLSLLLSRLSPMTK